MINSNEMFGGAALMGLMASCWMWFRTVLWKLVSLVICRASVSASLAEPIGGYFRNKCRQSPFSQRVYGSSNYFVRPLKQRKQVAFETVGKDPIIFWAGWFPLFVKLRNDPNVNNTSNVPLTSADGGFDITFIRGTFDLEKVVVELLNNSKAYGEGDRFEVVFIQGRGGATSRTESSLKESSVSRPLAGYQGENYRFLGYKASDIGEEKLLGQVAFSHLAFPSEVFELQQDIQRWKEGRDWYQQKRIPWRRGWCIYGAPGTGKSSLVKALAQANGLPLRVFDLGSMSNNEFVADWSKCFCDAPCIVLIEDIDSIFQGRKNRLGQNGGGLAFDCLLNTISGVGNSDGIFLVVTTNHPESLDPALGVPQGTQGAGQMMISTRPGRIDRTLELKHPDTDCLLKIARRILCDCPQEIDKAVKEGLGESGAQFQERCAQIALRHYWNRK